MFSGFHSPIKKKKKKNCPEVAWMTKLMHLMKSQRYYAAGVLLE